ncbi:leucyl aminopeptidase [Dictyobacter aurantiacus]|uniref:Probable cytosol aminopeptidase n=1 Tax=Dictyobacter aurantiacus TaxID=1936993 RepID=A0A401ZHK7_9CHLR|nr:leucyl aminopeptidase [Dictyobacter aurantiacus]GCE06364.1 putative cytosol aminopeptidase [Dictyobacter aurantiacus]
MEINLTTQEPGRIACDALIVSAARKASDSGLVLSPAAAAVDTVLAGLIAERNADGEFKGGVGELLTLHPGDKLAAKRVVLVGLGALDKLDNQAVRKATAIAARHLQKTGARTIAVAVGLAVNNFSVEDEAQAAIEGALLGLYTFRAYQSKENTSSVNQVILAATQEQKAGFEQSIRQAQAMAEGTNFARSLINEPPCVLTPVELANRASAMAKEVGLECEIFEKEKIQQLGMGGLLAVSKGSVNPPRFVILRYRGGDEGDKGMALVGKGITFDTGGISLKPGANMDAMKGDMGGAAAVLGAMLAIGRLKPAINVTAFVPTCDNMPSGSSYVPGDIVRIMNGKTIEIVNTDAEGRLILADALSLASQEGMSPILDLATLTGAMVVALGHPMTGFFSNDEQLAEAIMSAGRATGEKYWPMPLDEEYGESIKSEIADIKQTGGREAGAVTAAKILEHFVGNAKWAHLDIAGTSYVDSPKPYQEKGGTGVGVRTLTELAFRLAGR